MKVCKCQNYFLVRYEILLLKRLYFSCIPEKHLVHTNLLTNRNRWVQLDTGTMEHCGRVEHIDSHTSGRWEPVKISFRLKIFCYFSLEKEYCFERVSFHILCMANNSSFAITLLYTLKSITQAYCMSFLCQWINYKFLKQQLIMEVLTQS